MHIDSQSLSKACSESCFIHAFVFHVINKKKSVAEISTAVSGTMLVIAYLVPTKLVINSSLFRRFTLVKTKNKNQVFSGPVVW